jgi:uncharacterized membrane protein
MTTEQWIALWYTVDFYFLGAMALCLIVAAYRAVRWLYRAARAVDRLTKD